jgi:general secretion pathway protein K
MHCHRSSTVHISGQRGAALIIALLVFALCTALIVAMKSEFTLFYQRGSNVFVAEQAYAYLLSAEELASMALIADYDEDKISDSRRDDLTEFWAGPAKPYSIATGSRIDGYLKGSLEDLQGRFNLNSLLPKEAAGNKKSVYTASQQQFIRLLQVLPELEIGEFEAISITQSIGDWLDANTRVADNGAEDDFYFSQTPSYRTANRPMASVSELIAVANMTPEMVYALSPWVTVLPEDVITMNIHTASRTLLRTFAEDGVLQPLSEADADSLFAARCSDSIVDVEAFLAQPVFQGKKVDGLKNLLGVNSAYFLLVATAEVAERQARLYSVLERRGRAITTVSRTSANFGRIEEPETCTTVF